MKFSWEQMCFVARRLTGTKLATGHGVTSVIVPQLIEGDISLQAMVETAEATQSPNTRGNVTMWGAFLAALKDEGYVERVQKAFKEEGIPFSKEASVTEESSKEKTGRKVLTFYLRSACVVNKGEPNEHLRGISFVNRNLQADDIQEVLDKIQVETNTGLHAGEIKLIDSIDFAKQRAQDDLGYDYQLLFELV